MGDNNKCTESENRISCLRKNFLKAALLQPNEYPFLVFSNTITVPALIGFLQNLHIQTYQQQ